jgi:adenosylcobinamide kinase / adenosylcobinamide-phosphate guanylyltransferase
MQPAPSPIPTPHLVLGGARSGKSRYAEALIMAYPAPHVYVATAQVLDDEMHHRVEHHRRRRGPEWETVECPVHLVALLDELTSRDLPILVDCITLWLTNLILDDFGPSPEDSVQALCRVLHQTRHPLILVSNEVGSGIVPDNPLARQYRDLAGFANQQLAEACQAVTLVVAGLPMRFK